MGGELGGAGSCAAAFPGRGDPRSPPGLLPPALPLASRHSRAAATGIHLPRETSARGR